MALSLINNNKLQATLLQVFNLAEDIAWEATELGLRYPFTFIFLAAFIGILVGRCTRPGPSIVVIAERARRPASFPRPPPAQIFRRWITLVNKVFAIRFQLRFWGLLGQHIQQYPERLRRRLIDIIPNGRH